MKSMYSDQMHIYIKKFESELTAMAWGIANQLFDEQRKKLTSELTKVALQAEKKPVAKKSLATASYKLHLLFQKSGTWSRGGGTYRVLGSGEKPDTFELEDVKTGKKINATTKTLTSRWKYYA